MGLTLNQVIQRIETLALAHKQINHFFIGDPVEFLTNGDVRYPACFVELINSRVDRQEKYTTYNFRLWLCDLADVATDSQENEWEVKSDLTSIAEDMVAMLGYTEYRDWDIFTPGDIQYYTQKFEDLVIAAAMTVSIGVRFDANRCQAPADAVTFETQQDMIVNNYVYVGQGTEGDSLTVASLSSRSILMLFKGDKLLTATTGAPTVNEYKYTVGTGLFEFGNDIENGQVIQILYKNI